MFARIFTKTILVFVMALCSFNVGWAQSETQERPLQELISFEEFESLIMFNAGRMPVLEKLWQWTKANQRSDIYWTGGTAVRGFLRWHYLKLQNHSPKEIRAMNPPTLDDLQQLGGTDVDLIGPEQFQKTLEKLLFEVSELDVIDTNVYTELVKTGGPTIEKIGISPTGIMDPLHGLQHYYEGRLVFSSVPNDIFVKLPLVVDGDYSKTVEALRFIRFARALPELTPDAESIQAIRTIVDHEISFLAREDRKDWVIVTTEKLVKAYKGDIPAVVHALHQYNMLRLLSEVGVWIPSSKDISHYVDQGLIDTKKLSKQDLEDAKKVFPNRSPGLRRQIITLAMPLVNSARDLVRRALHESDTTPEPVGHQQAPTCRQAIVRKLTGRK